MDRLQVYAAVQGLGGVSAPPGMEPRQTTSNLGHLNKPSIQALVHGLNRHYYSILINYRKTHLENMLMNLHKTVWADGLTMRDFRPLAKENRER
ncbi:unnamed protein product [Tuber aestivum]|uniref:Uncharacterized protein n=1 Tax=Tuber aestivum TaxID=59557 RepID=A0A292Q1U2_9PEZI|nr:unnamed protein product [Tuber aestivum]